MNTETTKKAKDNSENNFFQLINHAVFRKTTEIVRNHRNNIKLITSKAWRNYLVSETNYHTTKKFSKKLLTIGMKKKKKHELL